MVTITLTIEGSTDGTRTDHDTVQDALFTLLSIGATVTIDPTQTWSDTLTGSATLPVVGVTDGAPTTVACRWFVL